MLQPETTESRFYRDLTQFLLEMKHLSLEQVEAEVERRFRSLLRTTNSTRGKTLHVTLTWTLPEGADAWAMYGTACALRDDTDVSAPPRPARPRRRERSRTCQVIPFPKRASSGATTA